MERQEKLVESPMASVQKIRSRSGLPTLLLTTEDRREIYLNSRYDPRRESLRWAESLELSSNSLLVLFGLGLGYHLEALLEKSNSGHPVIVFEPNPDTIRIARQQSLTQSLLEDSRVHLVTSWDEFIETRQKLVDSQQNIQLLTIPSYRNAYPELLQGFSQNLGRELLRIHSHYVTSIWSARQWQENFLHNIRYFAESAPVGRAFGKLRGAPLIIVSAGPSLTKNVDLLKEAKGKALVLAVGSVVKLLEARRVIPDLVISVDGGAGNYDRFSGVNWPGVPLLYAPTIYPRILAEYAGPKVLMAAMQSEWIARYLGSNLLGVSSGPSVSHMAFSLALNLEADPIIFVGQDLAYSGGHSHAEGLENTHVEADQRVRSIDGGEVFTSKVLLVFLSWFEEAIRKVSELNPSQKFINATEGGAHIAGTEVLSLRQTLQKYCLKDVSGSIAEIISDYSSPPDYPMAHFLKFLKTAHRKIDQLGPQVYRASLIASRLSRPPVDVRAFEKGLSRLRRTDLKLKKESQFLTVLDYLIQPISDVTVHLGGNRAGMEESARLYTSLAQAFEYGLPLILRSIQSLEQVLKEPHRLLSNI